MKATEKQKKYAKIIADELGYDLPQEDDKQAYSDFIDLHKREYKEFLSEMALDYEAEMESIDARRNW